MGNKRTMYINSIMELLMVTYQEDSAHAKSCKAGLKHLNTNQLDSLYCLILTSRGQ